MCRHWFVYVVRCADGSLYTGVTDDVERGIRTLNDGEGSAYVRARLPVFFTYSEEYMNEADVTRRAAAIKRLSREGKERLLAVQSLGSIGELGLAS